MLHRYGGLLLLTAVAWAAPSDHPDSNTAQRVLGETRPTQGNPRKLRGRFLHITDFHPDPFYKTHTDAEGEHPCHEGRGSGSAAVGHYGAATTDCDSPFALVNATFDWIERNIKEEIDFVVWTGDSARHDNDDDIPRSDRQVEDLNRYMVTKFVEVFGKTDNIDDPDPTNDFVVPIVPTFGNNDILPHNIFEPGPNRWTKRYLDIWAKFVPEAQRHSFARGGWFFTEVIPNRLAVISLNTLYFFDNNAAVDGCDLKSEPGYEHMEWLRIQLHFLRDRKMKAILMGHVPPARTESKQSWDETCYQKYTLWQRQYRDVIVANIYGHMNIDHFMFQDAHDLTYKFKIDGVDTATCPSSPYRPHPIANDGFGTLAKANYINELRAGWANLPSPPKGTRYVSRGESSASAARKGKSKHKEREKFLKTIGGEWAERFSMSLVSPSVVPNYFPTLRLIEYNITGLEHDHPAAGRPQGTPADENYLSMLDSTADEPDSQQDDDELAGERDIDLQTRTDFDVDKKKKKKKHKKKKKKRPPKPSFPVPRPPSSASPPGPAYSPQSLSLISWTQFYANLTQIHQKRSAALAGVDNHINRASIDEDAAGQLRHPEPEWLIRARGRADRQTRPTGHDHDPYFDFKVEYTTCNDSVYKLPDLTLRSWLDLAERIGRTEYNKRSSVADDDADSDGAFQVLEGDSIESETHDTMETIVVDEVDDSNGYDDDDNDDDNNDPAIEAHRKKKPKKRPGKPPQHSGRLKKNKLWHTFVKRVFVQTKSEADLEDDFD